MLSGRNYGTMEIFEMVKAVLDQEYENIVPEKERDQKITKALDS
jgi:hypothetical protein